MDYWKKLSFFKMYSQERRRERYMVIFLWKISQGLVHGYTVNFTGIHGRRGRTAIPRDIVSTSSASVKRARESSIGVKGVNIFNLLPASVRNLNTNNGDVFKEK